ncbi:PREDICTED: E3 ubiquitin-protein ligase ATL41-like [Lupinus angustifolius]|nr:PREDICTED: E3 ubiquitin-protein ligase ATL41-like [Lupinus angustifolius]
MLIGTVLLSIVILWFLALHIYERFVLRHQARRGASINHLTLTLTHAHDRTEPRNTGLDPLLIKALPMFIFKKKGFHQQQREDHADNIDDCAVCLSAFDEEEMVRLLPNCKHIFHVGCIDKWLASHTTCPICRTMAEPRLEPQPREGPNDLVLHGAPRALVLVKPIEGTSDVTTTAVPPKIIGSNS